MKLLIAIPSNRDWKKDFGFSLINLILHLAKSGVDARVMPLRGISNLPKGRQHALDVALDEGFTHLLFIDDDMKFTPKCFDLIISRKKDFIAPNCVNASREAVSENRNGERVYSKGKEGIEPIAKTGLAFALIRLEAIRNIPKPHFEIKWTAHANDSLYLGEDYFFCYLLSEHGVELFIDHDAAREIAHIKDTYMQEDFN